MVIVNSKRELREDSLKKRYIYKLSSNVVVLVFGVVMQSMIPRALGPQAYGSFSFLTTCFSRVVSILDMGTSQCFFIKLSKRQEEAGLVSFYMYFVGAVLAATILIVFALSITGVYEIILPGQYLVFIYLATGWGFLNWIVRTVLNNMADAYGVTVLSEVTKIGVGALGVVIIFSLFITKRLDLFTYFSYQYLTLILLGVAFIWIIKHNGHVFRSANSLSWSKAKCYLKEFYDYSHPLFVSSLVITFVVLIDRWMLQIFAGSVQQGYFGLAFRISALCLLFTAALTSLLTREYSLAFKNKDIKKMRIQFRRYVPLFYSITAFFSCYIALQADKVIYIIGGNKYAGAFAAVMVMAFFPICQTYGQLNGALILATDRTKLYRNIGVLFGLIGVPVTYFFIAPEDKMGMNAGAAGLALKTIILAAIGINVRLYYNVRYLRLSFLPFIGHQIINLICLLVLSWISMYIADALGLFRCNIIVSFIVGGLMYSMMTLLLVYSIPMTFGLNRKDIDRIKKSAHKYICETYRK